jgi:hypothetical protein
MPLTSRIALHALVVLPLLGLLAACPGPTIDLPPPETPRLEAVNLLGQRVCGPFEAGSTIGDFDCDPLPTTAWTGWQLTPLRKPHPTNPDWSIPNRGIVFTISTPSLTSIEVAYRASSGTRYVLSQVSPGPGRPQMLHAAPGGEVEVAAADDGVRKTWTIAANTNPCQEKMQLEVVNVSEGTRSDTLTIHVLRAPAETLCVSSPPVANVPSTFGTFESTGGTAMGTPIGPAPGPCSGGAQRTMFQFCLRCPTSGTTWVQSVGIEACSLADARAHAGYGPGGVNTGNGCTLSQTGGAQCEGGP